VAEYFLGQIMMTACPFAMKGFALANGQLMLLAQNQALFSLLGTKYGGDGKVNFQLPNLQGRAAAGAGPSVDPEWQPGFYSQGAVFGVENVALTQLESPIHMHMVNATTTKGVQRPVPSALLAACSVDAEPIYGPPIALQPLAATTVATVGGGTAHDNMQPFQVLNIQVALTGVFPSRQ
jgi:microcystin-dependent protein